MSLANTLFSKVVDEVLKAIQILETNCFKQLNRSKSGLKNDVEEDAVKVTQQDLKKQPNKNIFTYEFKHKVKENSLKAFELIKGADAKLDTRTKNSWRWRILYLRAALDAELKRTCGVRCEFSEMCMKELVEIYHAHNAEELVRPPLKNAETSR